jgi:small subunit ribosomal protein S20
MPNIKSSKKRMVLSGEARTKNRSERARIRTAIKRVRQAQSAEEGQTQLRDAVAILDRAATQRLYHPNRAARVKGKLARYVNSLS